MKKFMKIKNINWEKVSDDSLQEVLRKVKDEIDRRQSDSQERKIREAEEKLVEKMREIIRKDPEEFKTLSDAYYEIKFRDKFLLVETGELEFADEIPCKNYREGDCWYLGNMDRIGEFKGEVYRLLFSEDSFCEVCYYNEIGMRCLSDDVCFDEYEKYNEEDSSKEE